MCYIINMNKDVVYIEPEDDITDVITKIEKAKEKIVAVVPPKKAGVFRSIVNIKLMAKAGTAAGKTVVLVTVDPSITKLAAATRLPVAKNLQSAPVIPAMDVPADEPGGQPEVVVAPVGEPEAGEAEDDTEKTESVKESAQETTVMMAPETEESEDEPKKDEDKDEANDEEKKDEASDDEKDKKSKKEKSKKGIIGWIKNHKKTTALAVVLLIGLVVFMVWAFVFAPKVDITVAIKTASKNFSEGIT